MTKNQTQKNRVDELIKNKQPIGEKLSPILSELRELCWEHQYRYPGVKPGFSDEDLLAAVKIFSFIFTEKLHNYCMDKNLAKKDTLFLSGEAGQQIKNLVKNFTGIDTTK